MKITKEQEARILALDPNFFSLEAGKWYKSKLADLLVFRKSDEDNYGFFNKTWSTDLFCSVPREWVLATKAEIESALIEEAIRKGYNTYNTKCLLGINREKVTGNFHYDSNRLYSANNGEGGKVLFEYGKWAEIIKADKYYKYAAHLFKVSSKGYCIQVCIYGNNIGIQRVRADMPIALKADVATEKEFNTAYNSVSNKLINLKND